MVGWITYALSLVAYMRAHVNNTTYIFVNLIQCNSTYILLEIRRGKTPQNKNFKFFQFLDVFLRHKINESN